MSSPMKWQCTVLQGQWEERDETELGREKRFGLNRKILLQHEHTGILYQKKRGGDKITFKVKISKIWEINQELGEVF